MLTDLTFIERKIKYTFNDKELLQRAITHSSYANLKKIKSYERLEFLGDSILGFVVSDVLFSNYKDRQEGDLTKMRGKIVEGKNLALKLEYLGLDCSILVVKNVAITQKIKADVFEAIVAAIYNDGGYDKARTFILECFDDQIDTVCSEQLSDFKSIINERFVKHHVEYRLISSSQDGMEVGLYINGKLMSSAVARNKDLAEKICAEKLVESQDINS